MIEKIKANESFEHLHLVVCWALYEYFTSGFDAACSIFEQTIDLFSKGSFAQEELFLAYVKLVFEHQINNHSTPPFKLRNILKKALEVFPLNELFISLFIEGEARSQIANRIRTYFDEVCTKIPSPLLFMFSIHTETARLGSNFRARTLFERALEQNHHSIVLWRYYMNYELKRGDLESAKGIFYRAIRYLPWVKDIWLDSFRLLRDGLSVAELNDILSLMHDKDIRIRQLPEDINE